MKFEWDSQKNTRNIAKHGVSFEMARLIFKGLTVDRIDDRFAYGEIREFSIGMVNETVILAVVHTDRSGTCRIISARQADKKEKREYEKALQKTFDT